MNKINPFTFPLEGAVKSEDAFSCDQESRRQIWEFSRIQQETTQKQFTPIGVFPSYIPFRVAFSMGLLETAIKSVGLYRLGIRNALNIKIKSLDMAFPNLPDALDGYRILHLTDLHLDLLPGLEDAIAKHLSGIEFDLCVMTGDYQQNSNSPYKKIIAPLEKIVTAIEARDGVIATLGNHDDYHLAAALEDLGIEVLVNETVFLDRNGARLHVTGLDDVNRFFTPMAGEALIKRTDSFGLALVHSPEMAGEASSKGYALYLCGHTHGGQVCLPGGRPLMNRLVRNHDYAFGLWKCGGMTGYTSPGIGVSGVPVRFFCKGEATLVTLKKETSPS
ncbi:MAG TPA: metallophosphoesterase [Rhodospirillales bacterium]|nr:metallophosphoesterase [Rhodospirillales bacterium]